MIKGSEQNLTPYKSFLVGDRSEKHPIADLFRKCFEQMKNQQTFHIKRIYAVNNPQLLQAFLTSKYTLLQRWRTSSGKLAAKPFLPSFLPPSPCSTP